MSEPDTSVPETVSEEPVFNTALKWCKKNRKAILMGTSTFVLTIIAPVYWQYFQHQDWGILGVWWHVFSGSIDWSAWWGFGTFLVALIAAIIAYDQYVSHESERWEQVRALVQISYYIQGGLIFLVISNAGKTTARNIRISMDEDEKYLKEVAHELAKGTNEQRLVHSEYQVVSIDNEVEDKIMRGVLCRDKPFTSLAPGMNFTFLLGSYQDAEHYEVGKEPYHLSGTITYYDHDGKRKCPEEQFELDFSDMEDAIWPISNLPDMRRCTPRKSHK